MNGKTTKRVKKLLPVGIAMGILFSANPVTENRAYADVGTAGTILTTFGNIYDKFLQEPLANFLHEQDAKTIYRGDVENIAYKAPDFQKGEFGISVYDFYKNKDFSKKVKLAYPDGKVEYKIIKHGEQLKIKQVNTLVDLTPDEPEMFKHNIIHIQEKHLNGDAGISLTNWQTFYLKSAPHKPNRSLGIEYIQKHWGMNALHATTKFNEYFPELPHEKQVLATITSNPVSKEELFTLSDVEIPRVVDVLTQHKEGEYSSISVKIKNGDQLLQNWNDGTLAISNNETPSYARDFQITPIKKGSNKVFIKGYLKFISTETGVEEGYGVSPNRVWTLEDCGLFGMFRLKNEKGQYLSVDGSSVKFNDDHTKGTLFHTDLKESDWVNWLNKWYSGK